MKVLQNAIIRIDTDSLTRTNYFGLFDLSICLNTYRHFATLLFSNYIVLVCLSLFLFSTPLYSNGIDFEKAKQIASPLLRGNQVRLIKSTNAYYILGDENRTGYVIVAKRDIVATPILGYSETSEWVEEKMPPTLLQWLGSFDSNDQKSANQLSNTKTSGVTHDKKQSVQILMTSHWHQDSPYNDLCPVITDGNIKTAAGCVAIASSQVVYYWRKDNPQTTSEDTPIYPYGKAPVTYSIPAGTDFKWELMKDSYSLYETEEEKESVARLAYIIGTSTYLQYGTSTGGQINDIINPFSKQFNLNAKFASKKNFSQDEWENLIYNNLKKKQPVIYAGSTGTDAHAVVIDGYNATTNLYHFNFGWGGSGDGYYTIDDISGMNGYILGQECVYDIYPRQRNLKITISIAEELYTNTTGEIKLSVQNGSTFDIDGLYLYVSKNFIYPTDKGEAIWYQDNIITNDGNEHSFSMKFNPSFSGSRCYLILTDGEMNILAQKNVTIHESSGIKNVTTDNSFNETYYSLDGRLLKQQPNKRIYIRKKNNKATKVFLSK